MPDMTQPRFSPTPDNSAQPNDMPHEYWASLMYDQSMTGDRATLPLGNTWRFRSRPGLTVRRIVTP
ncbi:hypothetical protein [Aureimonas frigidaquae]|uniref:Beta-galactosidase n=1 Tax=Aureimonas frigidaquae TaxID=424757 RepID=A0A0P0Z3P3_9HYPH|nr:hypothetical protein [Aureimonas frigidaquae]BAT28692.1 beta-galactosidase [Aureimonas frigidaquae]